jgi:hypothetical protein
MLDRGEEGKLDGLPRDDRLTRLLLGGCDRLE